MKNIILISLMLMACSDKEDRQPANKNLFSLWTSSANSLDLRGIDFGAHDIAIEYTPNSGCACIIEIDGTQTEGTAMIHSCEHYGPVDYCEAGATIYDYTKSASTLTVCTDAGCEQYR